MSPAGERIDGAAKALRRHFPQWDEPGALVQLGTGFVATGLFDEECGTASMAELGLASDAPSRPGHSLTVTLGRIGDGQVLLAHGHRYFYERPHDECELMVAAAALAGVRDVVLLECGLSLREDLKPGTWMAATDYINAMGAIPSPGCLEMCEQPFLDMTDAFSQSLNSEIINATSGTGIVPRLGVYQGTAGPQFETPAEAEAARLNGADMLGNGVIPETLAGTLMGCRMSAFILAGQSAASYHGRRLRHADSVEAASFCSPGIMKALRAVFNARQPL